MGGIRLTGMASGLDTDSIVQGLTSAYQVKIDKVSKKKKRIELQKDAWATINSNILSFYKGSLSKIKTKGNYSAKKASVSGSNSNLATVKASSTAANGTYKMKVKSVASSAFISGANVKGSTFNATYNATNTTKFEDMNIDSLTGKTLTFTGTESVVKKNEAGNKLFTLTKNGEAQGIDIYNEDGTVKETKTEATKAEIDAYLAKLKQDDPSYNAADYKREEAREDVSKDYTYTFDASSSVSDLNNYLKNNGINNLTASMKDGTLTFKNTADYTKNEDGTIKKANASYNITGDALTTLGFESANIDVNVTATQGEDGNYTYNTSVSTTGSPLTYSVEDSSLKGKDKLFQFLGDSITGTAQTEEGTGKKYIEFQLAVGDEDIQSIKLYDDMTANDFADAVSEASEGKITGKYDQENGRFFFNSSETGSENNFTLTAEGDAANQALDKLGLVEDSAIYTTSSVKGKVQSATDAVIELNGAEITSSTNTVNVSGLGLTVTVENADPDTELTVNVSNDTSEVYNMVKDFLKEYNNLIADLAGKYYAEGNKYEPLTDEEEDAMTETQINKWNEKVTSALFRRDDRLNSIMNNMRTALAQSVSVKGADGSTSKFSLASLGITTGAWTEYGVLHLQGDKDDGEYASKEDKLTKMIEEDPDKVMQILSNVGQNLYDKVGKMMRSSSLNSSQTIYYDKQMKSQIDDYDDDVKKLQDKLTAMQDKYYDQFSKMEVAMSKINATASQLGFQSTTGSQY